MVILTVVLLGFISVRSMKKASMPLVESKQITVSVSYPGATPKEMDEGVTSLIENSIRGISGIKEFSSQSKENSASVSITAFNGYNMNELLSDVKNAVDGISNFPAGAEKPIVSKGRSTDLAMFVSLFSTKDNNELKLNTMANRIEDDFLSSGYMSQIAIYGIPGNLELVTEIDETQLRRYGITISDIRNAIENNNLDVTGGKIRNKREEISIIARKKSIQPKNIENIIIKGNEEGSIVRIKDVGKVRMQTPEDPSASYIDGKPAVTFRISKLENEDLEAISDYVNNYIKKFNNKDNGYKLRVKMDFLERINSQLDILINNGILGVVLVIIMLTLLLNFRLSLWVAWGIPFTFLGMFIIANMQGITLNMVSLFGMILIIGILVDDGVVIGENIFTHYEKGKSPRRAAIDGTMEVLPSVFTSVITTIVAFMPLFFIEGQMEMMYEMAFVVVICLIVSMFESIFVLPGHLAKPQVLTPNTEKSLYGRVRIKIDKGINYIKNRIYKPLLEKIIEHRGITICIVTGLLIITFGLVGGNIITYTFFPKSPSTTFSIDMALKPGVNEKITRQKLFEIENKAKAVNDSLMRAYGDKEPYITSMEVRVGRAFSGAERGANAGMIRVFLSDMRNTPVTDQILKREISEKVGKIPEAYKFAVGASNHFGAPVSISLLGYNNEELERAKDELESELSKMPALFNITDNSQIGRQELRLTLKPQAYALGLTTRSLLSEVRQSYYGGLAQRIQDGKNEIWVYVRLAKKDRQTTGQLENMIIHTDKGEFPLGTIANITTARSVSTINHYNGQREIRVDAYQKDMTQSVPVLLDYIETNILSKMLTKYPDITYIHQGQEKDSAEQMESLQLYFGLAFLIIILIIMVYFKSYNQGLMIILMIPLGIAGAIWGHGIHGQPISMISMWGMVALSGVIINDAIVFMSKYNQNLEKGMKVTDAVIDAGLSRFRAIILTTATTVAGLMPLILENNPDAAMLIPMAIALAYGIMFGTFFILVALPALIMLNNKFLIWKEHIKNRKNPDAVITPESVEPAVKYAKIEEILEINMAKKFED